MTIDNSKTNAYIMALYTFQFGLIQPIASIVNSQLPIAVFTLGLLVLMLLNNGCNVKLYVIAFFIVLSLYYLLNGVLISKNLWLTVTLFLGFLFKGFSGFVIGSLDTTSNELYNAFRKMAVLNFIMIGAYPFVEFLDSMNYMRFGYAMVPSVIIFWYEVTGSKRFNLIWWGITIYSTAITVIFGSRGTIVVLLLMILLSFLFSKKLDTIKKSIIVIFTSISIYFVMKSGLLFKVLNYLFFDLGIKSYTLEKLRMMVIDGIAESSSGRDELYSSILVYIKQNPVIGYGIGYSENVLGLFPHNIFLQILLESGFLVLIGWLCIWIFCTYKYRLISLEKETGLFKITTLIISVALGRLLISSDFWLRPEYWFVLSMLINYQSKVIEIKREIQ